MNKDFPRILTLLRDEHGLSQKKVAKDLNVSQALLSHYENGKRECSLDFLIKTAEYFDVSCDYLLGRTTMPKPNRRKIKSKSKNALNALNEPLDKMKYVLQVYYAMIESYHNPELIKNSDAILSLSVYSMFRSAYLANPKNDINYFSVGKDNIFPAFALLSSSLERKLKSMKINAPKTSFVKLYNEFPLEYKSLDDIIIFSEDYIKKLDS